ncbi:endospore germination permease [Paenibacillus tyrfis]|uniref:endospore germination permease n=1 Tax=Paenibacillus tyrfis TaxID=1501230 RepID=UPI002646DACC|nr:endospore germination permease [Paenibacillus tyrfis]
MPTISLLQASMILMLSTGLMNHVIIIPVMLEVAGRDAWISVFFATVLYMVWLVLIYCIVRRTGDQHIVEWISARFGKFWAVLFAAVFAAYLLYIGAVTTVDTVKWSRIYLPLMPGLSLTVLLVAICFYNAYKGLRSIAMTAALLLPIVVILGFFVMSSNIPHKNYGLLRPFFENGYGPALRGIPYIGAGLSELFVLVLMRHRIHKTLKYIHLLTLGILLVGLTMGPLIGAIVEFGPVRAGLLRYPAFEEWRLVNLGKYIEHLDFLSVYQWLSGAYIRISLAMYLIADMASLLWKQKSVPWLLVSSGLFIAAPYLPVTGLRFLGTLQTTLPYISAAVLALSLTLAGMTLLPRHRKGNGP